MKPVPLESLAEITMGTAPPGETYNGSGDGMPMIAGAGDYGDLYPEPKKWTTHPMAVAKKGDLIICVRATIGDLNWADREYCLGRGVAGIRSLNGHADIRYLAYYLDSAKARLSEKGSGSTFPAIRRADLTDFPIPIPFPDDPRRSLAEQKRIAAILDKADAIRRRRQEAARLADTLIPSVFYEMFGRTNAELQRWPMSPLGTFILDGPQNGLYRPATEYGSGTRIVRIDSFYQGELCHLDQLKRVRLEDDTIQKWLLRRDDLLINRVNSTEFLGKSAIVPEHDEPMVFESNMMRFRIDTDRLVPRFLIAMLQTRLIKGQILKKERPAVNQSSINQDDVKGLKVPTPPIELQRDFAKRVPAMQRQRDAQPPRAEAADTLFNSLVQRAFRGEL